MPEYLTTTVVTDYLGENVSVSASNQIDDQKTKSPLRQQGFLMLGNPPVRWRPPTQYSCSGYGLTRNYGSWSQSTYLDEKRGTRNVKVIDVPRPLHGIPTPTVHPIIVNGVFQSTLAVNAELTNMRNRVITEALTKVSDGNVNYGQMVFEARESANYLAKRYNLLFVLASAGMKPTKMSMSRARRAWRLYWRAERLTTSNRFKRARKRGQPRQRVRDVYYESNVRRPTEVAMPNPTTRMFRDFATFWVAYKFALEPLYADLHAAYVQQQARISLDSFITVARSSTRQAFVRNDVYSGRWTSNAEATLRVNCVLWHQVVNPRLLTAASMGLLNPASVAWELTSFSFLFDWLVPIGQMLEALNGAFGTKFLTGTVSTKHTCISDHALRGPDGWATHQPARIIRTQYRYERTPLTSKPLPRLYVKSPFSTSHVATAAALYTSHGLRRV